MELVVLLLRHDRPHPRVRRIHLHNKLLTEDGSCRKPLFQLSEGLLSRSVPLTWNFWWGYSGEWKCDLTKLSDKMSVKKAVAAGDRGVWATPPLHVPLLDQVSDSLAQWCDPKNPTEFTWNWHFSAFTKSLFSKKWWRICLTWTWCSATAFEKMRMSSKYTKAQGLMKSWSTSLTNAWNTAGALVNSKGITRYSKWPWWVLNSVFYLSPSLILTKW